MADPDARRDDAGFTLMELMVVVLLVAVLATVIVAVITVILRNAPSAEVQADNSRSYRGLTTWLPRDAASTPPGEFIMGTTPSPSPWSCSGISGPAIVRMAWSLEDTAYVAGYRLEAGDGGQRISRYACSGPVGGSTFPNPTIRSVTNRLNNAEAAPIFDDLGEVVGVRIDMTTCGEEANHRINCSLPGLVVSVEASSHNPGPANTLPPTTASP